MSEKQQTDNHSQQNQEQQCNESQFSLQQLERNIISIDNLPDQKSQENENNPSKAIDSILIFISFLISFFYNLIAINIISIYYTIIECNDKYQLVFILIVSNCSYIYTQIISFFYFLDTSSILKFLFFDVLYFQVTFLVVITYFKVCSQNEETYSEIFAIDYLNDGETLKTVNLIQNYYGYKFKLPFKKSITKQNLQNMYSPFRIQKTPSELIDSKEYPLINIEEELYPNLGEYSILMTVVIIKLGFAFYYIYLHRSSNLITWENLVDISVAIVVQFYSIFLLNKVLGNYDLRQKLISMQELHDLIDFQDIQNQNYKEKIEITCPISLETWDTRRQSMCAQDYDQLQYFEYSYLCFFFYYVFILLVMIAYYGEFYWLIPKESILLQPLLVILSTFNFIFLSFFLYFRIWQGQKFNDSFGEIEQSLDYLIDITKDILTMYEAYFQPYRFMKEQQLQDQEEIYQRIQVENKSVQGLIINKIKLLSNFYVENNVQYQGEVYFNSNKQNLRKEILRNMNESLIKLKISVQNDSQKYCYKFLNVSQIQFTEALTTTVLASVSFIPQVIPKFIEFYSQKQE